MAVINSKQYQDGTGFGRSSGITRPQYFKKMFITGEPREGQTVGTIQCYQEFGKEFIVNNKTNVYFIPLFIKRTTEQHEGLGAQQKMVYFDWESDQDTPRPEKARYVFYIGGIVMDDNMKPIARTDEPSKNALIFFRLGGMYMTSAIEFMKAIDTVGDKLAPLSDDPVFEKNEVTFRRFIMEATTQIVTSDYGNKTIFKFVVKQQLPDEMVEKIIKQCVDLKDKIKEQFDASASVVATAESRGAQTFESNKSQQQAQQPAPVQQVTEQPAPTVQDQNSVADLTNLDLGI